MLKTRVCNIILILLIISEMLFVLFLPEMKYTSQPVNATVQFIVSLLVGFVVLIKFYNMPAVTINAERRGKSRYVLYFLIAAAFILLNSFTIHIIKTFDFRHYSDIIPAVEILTKRLLSGQNPYDAHAMEPLLYHGPSNYLSMHWLPYVIAEYFHFDYRTISFAIWCAGALFLMLRSVRFANIWTSCFVLITLSAAYLLVVFQANYIIGATIETMVAGYYMLFIAGINQRNSILTGFFIAICLLSRYFVAFWLPLWFFVLLISGNKKQLFKTSLAILFFLLILYIIPFLSKDWSVPFASFKAYENLPYHEWLNHGENCPPGHLYNGTGFAYLFYEHYLHTDLFTGYLQMKKLFFYILGLTLFLLGLWYWLKRKKINYKIFLLASFKVYLSVFLGFILIPYLYLMITGIFVSIAIFAEQACYKIKDSVE